jgi:hypothetical protein
MNDIAPPMEREAATAPSAIRRLGGICGSASACTISCFWLLPWLPPCRSVFWHCGRKDLLSKRPTSVQERHLLVARNLTSTMSRYVNDVKAAFTVAFESGALTHNGSGLAELLTSLNFIHVCVIGPDGKIESWLQG